MNVLAFYLPQYHTIKENSEWWEPDFTEWTNMKRAVSLAEGHYQPRIPKDKNYYDLSDVEVMKWQVNLAKEYGVYGFIIYHYWFDGKLLLEKPMENFLKEKDIDFPFSFCWANDNWTNVWKGENDSIKALIMNHYGNKEDWIKHFNYMLPFFKDERYMKEDNKPILTIYNPVIIEQRNLKAMIKTWNELARSNGFAGIKLAYQSANSFATMNKKQRDLFDYGFEYVPPLVAWSKKSHIECLKNYLRTKGGQFLRKIGKNILDKKIPEFNSKKQPIKIMRKYEDEWEDTLSFKPKYENIIPGAFVDWDNTPRYSRNGKILLGACPEKFKEYMIRQINRTKDIYKKNAIMLFAWNEWSEGGYLEPDERFGYGYLEALKEALIQTNEFPKWDKKNRIFS